MLSAEFEGVIATMRWTWGKESRVRCELDFGHSDRADKAGGRMMSSGSHGGVGPLFDVLRTRENAKTHVNGSVIPLEITWKDHDMPLKWSVLALPFPGH